jgi:Holliday junction resolvasome RuvABC endonuclease subunit
MERVLSLDVSSKTGFSVLNISANGECMLETYGKIDKVHCPEDESYPGSYVTWAYLIFGKIEELIERYQPDVLVIEQTCAGSKNAMSQKILEFSHFLLCKYVQETGIKNFWFLTGEWRKEVGSYMNKSEKELNKYIKDYKKKTGKKLARDKNNKVVGQVTKKKVTIRLVNDIFKDQLETLLGPSEDDIADAIALSYCYFLRKQRGLYA